MKIMDKTNHFNLANLITFANISCGLIALFCVTQGYFWTAAALAWCAGVLDIADGKIARRFDLSTPFGIQLDSFADFLSFVVMPAFFLFFALKGDSTIGTLALGIALIWYVICGLRRLVAFNLASDGGVAKYFIGVPTPLGAILLWLLWLLYVSGMVANISIAIVFILIVAYLLNSKLKIPHP